MLWPTGVLQDEIEVAANREQNSPNSTAAAVPVLRSLSGMASIIDLVGDMLGAGVVGHWIARPNSNATFRVPPKSSRSIAARFAKKMAS